MIKTKTQARGVLLLVMAGVTGLFFMNCSGPGSFSAQNGDTTGADPFLEMAWHINNTAQRVFASESGEAGNDLNLLQTWLEGYTGKGIKILISDDGVEDSHEDLKDNYLYSGISKDYVLTAPYLSETAGPKASDDNHGTTVAGLAAAVAENGLGTKGVAYQASLVSANFLTSSVTQTLATLVDQAGGDYDVFNMSWGSTQNTLVPAVNSFHSQLRDGVINGRGGKGSIYVKSAGNDFMVYCKGSSSEYCVGNANFDSDNNTPYTILVSALNASGVAASYSSVGSNVWISSFGGEFGDDGPAMITTDRMGCSKGFSTSTVSGKLAFERGGLGNIGCNYTATFNGTSAAAPVLTGAVALLLQANSKLTWRDVKYILAKTAVPVHYTTSGSITHPLESVPSGYKWEQAWIQNAAGFKFHNWYGFGRLDVDGAVSYARSYTSPFGTWIETNWADENTGLSLAVPDNSGLGVTDTLNVASNVKIESVQLKVWITHTHISDLALELTSPSGTKSIIINMNNSLRDVADYQGELFLSNAFYREDSAGAWKLKVIDGKEGHTGTVTRWSLNFTGGN